MKVFCYGSRSFLRCPNPNMLKIPALPKLRPLGRAGFRCRQSRCLPNAAHCLLARTERDNDLAHIAQPLGHLAPSLHLPTHPFLLLGQGAEKQQQFCVLIRMTLLTLPFLPSCSGYEDEGSNQRDRIPGGPIIQERGKPWCFGGRNLQSPMLGSTQQGTTPLQSFRLLLSQQQTQPTVSDHILFVISS